MMSEVGSKLEKTININTVQNISGNTINIDNCCIISDEESRAVTDTSGETHGNSK